MNGRIGAIARLYEAIAPNRKHVLNLIVSNQISVALTDKLGHSWRTWLPQKPIREAFVIFLAKQTEAGSVIPEVVGSTQRRSKPTGMMERHSV